MHPQFVDRQEDQSSPDLDLVMEVIRRINWEKLQPRAESGDLEAEAELAYCYEAGAFDELRRLLTKPDSVAALDGYQAAAM